MSAMMTTTMLGMKKVIKMIKEKNPNVAIMLGGAPVTKGRGQPFRRRRLRGIGRECGGRRDQNDRPFAGNAEKTIAPFVWCGWSDPLGTSGDRCPVIIYVFLSPPHSDDPVCVPNRPNPNNIEQIL